MLLATMGVWGQVLMDVQYKKHEIALKRVFGADTRQITNEGTKYYLGMLLISFALSLPTGWLVANTYLQQFAERVDNFYIVTAAIIAIITVATICTVVVRLHYIRTANANPAKTLKVE